MRTNTIIFTFLTFFILSSPAQADDNKFNVGIGSYALSITDQIATQTFSGAALILGYTINDYVAVNSHIYSLKDDFNQSMDGYDIALRLGKFTPGFNAFVQGGIFSETLSSSTSSATRDFSVTFLGFVAGYKWDKVGIELDVSRRAIKDYQGTSTANIDAATSSLSISYLF
jgi:hypothetical protein